MPINLPNTKRLLEGEIKRLTRGIKRCDKQIAHYQLNLERLGSEAQIEIDSNTSLKENQKLWLAAYEKELDIISKL